MKSSVLVLFVLSAIFAHFMTAFRRTVTCKPGKPRLTSFSETLVLFFIQFLSFRKMKVQDRQNGPSKSFRAYQKNTGCLRAWLYGKWTYRW